MGEEYSSKFEQKKTFLDKQKCVKLMQFQAEIEAYRLSALRRLLHWWPTASHILLCLDMDALSSIPYEYACLVLLHDRSCKLRYRQRQRNAIDCKSDSAQNANANVNTNAFTAFISFFYLFAVRSSYSLQQ